MSEIAETPPRETAGTLLRAARERQGLHIAALAAAIKVAPRKLDALEHDRYDELPDATFTRALAQTVCRSLKIDPQPVLALLPAAEPSALDHVSAALNEPFRERPGRSDPGGAAAAIRPLVVVAFLLLAAAAAVYFVPSSVWQGAPAVVAVAPAPTPATVPPPMASAPELPALTASAPAAAVEPAPAAIATPPLAQAPAAASAPTASLSVSPTPAPTTVVAAAPPAATAAVVAPPVASGKTLVQLRADEASWIEARDGHGQLLLSRTVQAGESVGLDGALPIRMTIGNAPATRVSFRGKPVDLGASTRDAVARIELQ